MLKWKNTKNTINDCYILASNNDGHCLDTEYTRNDTYYLWKCNNKKHPAFRMKYNSVQQGRWCPLCRDTKLDSSHCISLAEKNDGHWLSERYINNKKLYLWKCKNTDHDSFKMAYNDVSRGSWCPKCSNDIKRNAIECCHMLAKQNNGKFLSQKYIKNTTKYLWSCDKGHVFQKSYSAISSGQWCPECALFGIQGKLKNLIKDILKKQVLSGYSGFEWLKYKKKLHIDIWVPELKIAIEYDGEQHFKPVRFGGKSEEEAKKTLKETKKRDKIKNKLIKQHQEEVNYFIRFNYKENITEEYVKRKLIKSGIKL